MPPTRAAREADVDRAALAFSLLPLRLADEVNTRLSNTERQRLREGLDRVREASDRARIEAIRALSAEVRRGAVFPHPPSHDERDCPFTVVGCAPRHRAVEVLRRVAERDPLEVAVTLCHLSENVRREIWDRLDADTRAPVMACLRDVPTVTRARTREYARDIGVRLSRSTRQPIARSA